MADKLNRHESKYFNTARLMNEALVLLLFKKDYEFITIKDICERAGVNRSTFYLHYENMDDLLTETLEYTTNKFNEKFVGKDKTTIAPLDDLMLICPKYLYPYLDFLRENKKLYLAAITHTNIFKPQEYFNHIYKHLLLPILEKLQVPQDEQKYVLAYYISGIHSMILEWLKDGCKENNEYIYNLLSKYIFNGQPQ